jgi:hypothetical protein
VNPFAVVVGVGGEVGGGRAELPGGAATKFTVLILKDTALTCGFASRTCAARDCVAGICAVKDSLDWVLGNSFVGGLAVEPAEYGRAS